MKIFFTLNGSKDFDYWKKNDPSKVEKIKKLIESIKQTPFEGIGKPEPLKFKLKGLWSRRIDRENRLVYQIKEVENLKKCIIYNCRFHYSK